LEGKDIVIEWRSAEAKAERLPGLAAELVRLKVDIIIIITGGPTPTRAAKKATVTMMAQDADPVASGFVDSLARPGGNITGLSTGPGVKRKVTGPAEEILPKLTRVAVFGTSTRPGNAQSLKEVELSAGAIGVKLQYLDVLSPKDIETAFRAAGEGRADAVLMFVAGGVASAHRSEIVELAVKSRLSAIYDRVEFVEVGGLMTYTESSTDLFRRAAMYVDKILKAQSPPIYRLSSRPSSSWSLILKRQNKSASRFRRMCWRERTR
jgi:putative tryptophan/tyrosine transport system substrate-binding protein